LETGTPITRKFWPLMRTVLPTGSTPSPKRSVAVVGPSTATDALDRWNEDLAHAAGIFAMPEVEQIVDSPAVPLTDRLALVARLLGGTLQPAALRLVNLLVQRGRASSLRRVSDEFNRQLNAHRGVVMATVTSAVPLTSDETAAIRSRVEAMAGAAVVLRAEVDPGLLGGLTIQVRDQLLDASIRGRMERLRTQLHAGGRLR
jgi:F-type H+-transporting ATPase subunit delta